MRTLCIWLLGIGLAADGAVMLAAPHAWYELVPGIPGTGPFNAHFVRDIGCAHLVSGAALLWLALDADDRAAALAGGAFLALHALAHVWDAAAGRESLVRLLADLPAVPPPPAPVLWLIFPAMSKGEALCSNG